MILYWKIFAIFVDYNTQNGKYSTHTSTGNNFLVRQIQGHQNKFPGC